MTRRTDARRRGRGFTLVETLVATAIVALLAGAVTVGVMSANEVYRQSTFVSESGLLADTVNMAVSDVLRYAVYEDEATVANGVTSFTNKSYQTERGYFMLDGGTLRLNTTGAVEPDALPSLLTEGAYADMKLRDFTLAYDADTQLYSGSYTIVSKLDSAMTKQVEFGFRSLTP